MSDPRSIRIEEFTYNLPEERIAAHPLHDRDESKLLIFEKGIINESQYKHIDQYLPSGSLLVFNNTKVINARMVFKKSTGTSIEIFCLEPLGQVKEYSTIMSQTGETRWKCLVGGAAKWKNEVLEKNILVDNTPVLLRAKMMERNSDSFTIAFDWTPSNIAFASILEVAGDIPLPPYIKRKTEIEDTERYQTIYARHEGSVAAPTAGLHFTEDIFTNLDAKSINKDYVTLHVGAGTFKPVKSETMEGHDMHSEWIDINRTLIDNILINHGNIIAVGTTSLRTVETLYWLGLKLIHNPETEMPLLSQWEIYESPLSDMTVSPIDALKAIQSWMDKNKCNRIFTQTQLLIVPGYRFRIVKGLITNFHQPGSTLLLLVAAAVGENWKRIYQYALTHDFRFLSYGDGNLLFL